MPGKQMAIDSDLSAGLIGEDEARSRRKTLEDESNFFGAMDGAAKFVRGDAIAGLLITFINVIGGMIIGVVQQDHSFADAAASYTMLTVGDGLVTQIPAIIVSTAAGLLVSKAGIDGSTDKAVFGQLGNHPRAFGLSSAMLVVLAMLPGIPVIPFLLLAGGSGALAWRLSRDRAEGAVGAEDAADGDALAPAADEPIATALRIDQLRLELGYSLLALVNNQDGHRLTEQIKALRRQIASEIGFVMPSVRIQDNMQLSANTYVIRVKDIEGGRGEVKPGMMLAMDPRGEAIDLPGEETREPTFGLPAMWISESNREEAAFRGYTVVDPPTVLTTHLTEVIKEHMADLLSYAETQKLLDELDKEHQKLVADLVPAQISVTGIQRVLHSLLAERVSIRDLPTILEGISESAGSTQNITLITEHVRTRLARQLMRRQRQRGRRGRAGDAVARLGAGVRRGDRRQGRRAPVVDGAEQAAGVHRHGAPDIRAPRHNGRIAGAAVQPGGAPVRALDRRALSRRHGGHVAERNPSQGEDSHGGANLMTDRRSLLSAR